MTLTRKQWQKLWKCSPVITYRFCTEALVIHEFQGDRFGGALDAAAKQFSKAFDSGMLPMEFVNKMKKDGKLIMGIGHRVKSVSGAQFLMLSSYLIKLYKTMALINEHSC